MTVQYEWDCELVATEDTADFLKNDVIEHFHQESFADCKQFIASNKPDSLTAYRIVLVRDETIDGRSWAYLDQGLSYGMLPEYFEDAYERKVAKVPKIFIDEVSKLS